MKTPRKETQVAVRLEERHHRLLAEIAKREDRAIAAVVRRIVVKALEGEKRKKPA